MHTLPQSAAPDGVAAPEVPAPAAQRPAESPHPALVWVFSTVLALSGAVLVWWVPSEPLNDAVYVPGVVLGLWITVANLAGATFTYRDSGVDTALHGVPLLVGLAFTPLVELTVWLVAGSLLAHLIRSDEGRKVVFNTALTPVHVGVTAATVHLLTGGAPVDSVAGAGALAVGLALADTATLTAVIVVIRLASGASGSIGTRALSYVLSLMVTAVSVLLGLLAIWATLAVTASLVAVALLSLAVAILTQLATNRTQRSQRLAALERAVDAINSASDGPGLQRLVVAHAKEILHARRATLLLRTPTGHVVVGDGHDPVAEEILTSGRPVRRTRRNILRALVRGHDTDALGVPIGQTEPTDAALVVRDSTTGFEDGDLRLLSDLARHVASALSRHRLVDLLRQEVAVTERAARTDALTQLPNRDGLLEALNAAPGGGLLVVCSVDGVGDLAAAFGRSVADGLLIEVASRLTSVAGPRRCARLADASFAVWLPDARHALAACADVEEVLGATPVRIDEVELPVPLVIGAVDLDPQLGPDEILRRARVALSAATLAAPVVYDEQLDSEHARRLQLTRELRDALATDQLSLHYQPKADLRTGGIVGVEALARWIHPEHGFVSPLEFVGLAERSGTIGALTRWAIGRACREAAGWAAEGRVIPVAVNLSPRDLLDPTLPDTVANALASSGLRPDLLRLEITESVMVVDPERSRDVVAHLRSTGVSISIDDFGAGYASFGHLRRFAVDELKIDRSLVMELDVHGDAIVRAIVALAVELGLKTVAEGVEDQPTWQRLADAGVDACQGWVLARPMPPAELDAWLTANPDRLHPALSGVGATGLTS